MAIKIPVPRSREDVHAALLQFAARRGYTVSNPWWLDGIRIEDMRGQSAVSPSAPPEGFWAWLSSRFSVALPPRVDIEISRKRSRTILSLSVARTVQSAHLAYALQAYLKDAAVYELPTPVACPNKTCAASITNLRALFCGRCGEPLTAAARITRTKEYRAAEDESQSEDEPKVLVSD